MPVIVRMALRNLVEHKSKTLIIGIIIAVGVLVLVVGNSLMDTATLGIKRSFTENFTGDVMVSGVAEGKISLFGVQSVGGMVDTPVIPNYEEVRAYLENHPDVKRVTSQVTGFALVQKEDVSDPEKRSFTLLFGIEPDSYHAAFDNINIIDGAYLKPGDTGIMLSKKSFEDMEKNLGTELAVGDKILLNGFGKAGFSIREVPIAAVFTFKQEGDAGDMISYIDAQTLRALKQMLLSNRGEVELTEEEVALLRAENPEELFSDTITEAASDTSAFSEESLLALFDTEEDEEAVPEPVQDNGAWEYLLVQLENPAKTKSFIRDLNIKFAAEKQALLAADWKAAAGPFSSTADVVRIVFNIAVMMVAVVAVIIMMNTLVISVVERTSEIGTMRALGAQKGFIRRLFGMEITGISLFFGIVGIALGLLTIWIINLIGIESSNTFVQILFAGPVLHPVVNPVSIVSTLVGVILLGLVADLYPVSIAMKIQPVRAMQSE